MAGTLEIPTKGNKNESEDPKIKSDLETLNNKLDASNLWPDTALTSPNNVAYRTILAADGMLQNKNAAGTYFLPGGQGSTMVLSAQNAQGAFASLYFAKADYEVGGKTQKLRLRAQIAVNATKPTLKFTLGLYPISSVAGSENNIAVTLGTVVSGSTVEFNEPAASTLTQGNSGDFTIPADGAYVIGLVTSAELTAKSAIVVNGQLQTRSV
jgi:hypothetical protein